MIKIDFNFQLKSLDGKAIEDASAHAGKLLGNILVASTKGEALKYYDWAVKLHKLETLDVDRSDLDRLLKFVNETELLPILSKAQLLEVLKKAEAEL